MRTEYFSRPFIELVIVLGHWTGKGDEVFSSIWKFYEAPQAFTNFCYFPVATKKAFPKEELLLQLRSWVRRHVSQDPRNLSATKDLMCELRHICCKSPRFWRFCYGRKGDNQLAR
jgi:hypothetical protein